MLHGFSVAHSSTSYRTKWKPEKTTVIRVPQTLAAAVLRYAHELDRQSPLAELHEAASAGRTAENAQTTSPLSVECALTRPV